MAYQILACHAGDQSRESILSVLKSRVSNICDEVCKFDVPDTLKFGSFDSLIKLMDELSKYDGQVEAIVRRIERQILDLDANADLKVLFRQKTMSVESYLRSFQWDDTKFPRNRNVSENLTTLWAQVGRADDEVKAKVYTFSDIKSGITNMNKLKGPGASLNNVDLTEVLTPDVVAESDFVTKEHLTTVLVVVPSGSQSDKDFQNAYEKMDQYVVPRSAKKFQRFENGKMRDITDKDGATLWRVVLFKTAIERFRKGLKEVKCVMREFTYSPEAYKTGLQKAEQLQSDFEKSERALKVLCGAAFSETLVAWMHLKAMRVFVESILRYGVPPNFSSFIVRPLSQKNLPKLRSVLTDVFSSSGLFGQNYIQQKGEDEEEAYYPYVSIPFTPLCPKDSH